MRKKLKALGNVSWFEVVTVCMFSQVAISWIVDGVPKLLAAGMALGVWGCILQEIAAAYERGNRCR